MKDFRVDHLKKTYGAKTLLADVSFIINEGEHVGLIGQNGTGKSSLLNILAGIDEAESGTITCSNDFRIGHLSQNPSLNPEHTVFEAIYQSDNPENRTDSDNRRRTERIEKSRHNRRRKASPPHRISASQGSSPWSAGRPCRPGRNGSRGCSPA